jgi:hypothetical protein
MAAELNFNAKRIARTSVITLNAPLNAVFPLFGPVREMEWAHGWQPEILYPVDQPVAEHMVFKTRSHGHGEPDYTWIVSHYAPQQSLIEYTVFTPERLWTITIRCRAGAAAQTTQAEITYTYTGLTERGNAINERALHVMYARELQDWAEEINEYLGQGAGDQGIRN